MPQAKEEAPFTPGNLTQEDYEDLVERTLEMQVAQSPHTQLIQRYRNDEEPIAFQSLEFKQLIEQQMNQHLEVYLKESARLFGLNMRKYMYSEKKITQEMP